MVRRIFNSTLKEGIKNCGTNSIGNISENLPILARIVSILIIVSFVILLLAGCSSSGSNKYASANDFPTESTEQTMTPTFTTFESPTPTLGETPTSTDSYNPGIPIVIIKTQKVTAKQTPKPTPKPTSTKNTSTILYSFEGTTSGWTTMVAPDYGPEPIPLVATKEWAASGAGSYSLKQEFALSDGNPHYIKKINNFDFSNRTSLSITANTECSTTLYGKVYLNTEVGGNRVWRDSGDITLKNDIPITITLPLGDIEDLDSVVSIGIQFYAPSDGEATVYIDKVYLK